MLALISSVREGDAPDKRYPSYLYEFITAYLALSAEELYRAEDMLSACYYAYAMNCGNQFVSSWFEFNLNINNILAALAARKYKMDVSQVVVGKTDVSEMIRTSNARDFGLSEMLEYFEQVLRISEIEELVEREKEDRFVEMELDGRRCLFQLFYCGADFRVFVETGNDWPLDFYG